MPINPNNTQTFYRITYAQELETVTILKRNNDQGEGTITSYLVFNARHSYFFKTGETLQNSMSADDYCTWHFPKIELQAAGINNPINNLDRIIDKDGRYWQPEAGSLMTEKLFRNHVCVDCKRCDPNPASTN